MEQKRQRDVNFSGEESVLLLDLVLKYKDIVENKNKSAIIWNEKKNAWRIITEEFNASAKHKRSLKSLKFKYEAMRKFLKKKFVHYEKHKESSYEQLPLCAPVEKDSSIFSFPVQDNINVNENSDVEVITEEVNDNLIHNIKSEIPEFEQEPLILDLNQEVASSFNSEFRKRTISTSVETERISDIDVELDYNPINSPKSKKPMNNNCYSLKQKLINLQIKLLQYDLNIKQIDKNMNELKMQVLKVDLQIKQAE